MPVRAVDTITASIMAFGIGLVMDSFCPLPSKAVAQGQRHQFRGGADFQLAFDVSHSGRERGDSGGGADPVA